MSGRSATSSKRKPPNLRGEEKIRTRNIRVIIDAATLVFARRGFDGARIAEIADQAKLPKTNVYYYFSSKEEIYEAVIAELIKGWDDALAHISRDREPIEALEAYVRAKLEYSRRNVDKSRVFAAEILRGGQYLSRRDHDHMRLITRRHAEVIEHWIAAGKIRRVDPRHLFIMLWSATQFYADFETLACDALESSRLKVSDYDAAARTIVATTLRGLQP